MKYNKKILEAIQRGINLAIDDFDDEDTIEVQKKGEIENKFSTKDYLIFKEVTQKIENRDSYITRSEFNMLPEISKKLGIKYVPKDLDSLKKIVRHIVDSLFIYNADLNWIDVSGLTELNGIFSFSSFNGDISEWDVSNVKSMYNVFYNSCFDGDISKWDVSNVENMSQIFDHSKFDDDISKWNVSNVKNMYKAFNKSKFTGDISKWDVSHVINMEYMFAESEFNGDISDWNVSNVQNMCWMFFGSNFAGDLNKWKVPAICRIIDMFGQRKYTSLPPIPTWYIERTRNVF